MFRESFIFGLRDLMWHLTSGILCARLINRNLDSLTDGCVLDMSCVGYVRAQLKPFRTSLICLGLRCIFGITGVDLN